MSLDERVSELLKRIYAAADDAGRWDQVVEQIVGQVGGHAAIITLVDLNQGEYASMRALGAYDSRFAQGLVEYNAGLYKDDFSLNWAILNPTARFCDSYRVCDSDEYLFHPYVRWNRARFGSTHWYVGYTPTQEDLHFSCSIHFPASQGPGDAKKLRLFRMLFEHMDSSMRLCRRPFDAESNEAELILDGKGIVRALSLGAHSLLNRANAPVTMQEGRMLATNSKDQGSLEAAFFRALSAVDTGTGVTAVKLAGRPGEPPWIVTVRPMIRSCGPFAKALCELWVRIQVGTPAIGSLCLLEDLFDLTRRELEIVRQLADGHSIESIGGCLGISPNTVRTHLRSIFSKTGVTRQSELLRLCAGLASS